MQHCFTSLEVQISETQTYLVFPQVFLTALLEYLPKLSSSARSSLNEALSVLMQVQYSNEKMIEFALFRTLGGE